MGEYVSSVKFCGFDCVYGFVAGDKDRCFRKCVRNCKYGIVGF